MLFRSGVADGIIHYNAASGAKTTKKALIGVTSDSVNSKYVYDEATGGGHIEEDVVITNVTAGSLAEMMGLKKDDRIKIKTMGTSELLLSKESVELRYLEQLKDQEQTAALAWVLKFAELKLMDGRKTLKQIGDFLEKQLDRDGLESLFDHGEVSSSLARPRKQEIMACINRYRKLRF